MGTAQSQYGIRNIFKPLGIIIQIALLSPSIRIGTFGLGVTEPSGRFMPNTVSDGTEESFWVYGCAVG